MMAETVKISPTAEIRRGIVLFGVAIVTLARGAVRLFDYSVHRYPYPWLLLVIFSTCLTSFICIGQARAERDILNKKYYQLQQKVEPLGITVETTK